MIVATAKARRGGLLDCGCVAQRGDPIYKVDLGDRGPQTSHGNGQGRWCCAECATAADDQPA